MGLFKTDTWFAVGTSSVLILLFAATLIKVCNGSKYDFFIKLLVLLLISNVSQILYSYSFFQLVKGAFGDEIPFFWISMRSVSAFILFTCFNVSHWMFAFLYYKIARLMPFVLKEQVVPENIIKCDNTLNKIMLFLNIFLPFLYALTIFYGNWNMYNMT